MESISIHERYVQEGANSSLCRKHPAPGKAEKSGPGDPEARMPWGILNAYTTVLGVPWDNVPGDSVIDLRVRLSVCLKSLKK